MDGKTACIVTFGCQMNVADSEVVRRCLAEAGYLLGDDPDTADVIIFNTCSVRDNAEAKVRDRLYRLRRRKQEAPEIRLVVMGCMAQRLGGTLRRDFPHVDLVVGTSRFTAIPDLLARIGADGPLVITERAEFDDPGWGGETAGVNAYIPVMRGCDYRCTYCIVPTTRGPTRSRAPAAVAADVDRAVAAGKPQVTLLGQTVDSYGHDRMDGTDLAGLLRLIHDVPGLQRIRFVTSHPKDIDDHLLAAMTTLPKVARHLHIPAQSGSSRVLRRMGRRYDREGYLDVVARARHHLPDLEIQSDFIVGFPGETAEDFADTASLVESVRFAGCFVFTYSPRPGTPATRLPDDVPPEEKKRRCNHLLALQRTIQTTDHAALIGRTFQVLVEGPSKNAADMLQGRSEGNRNIVLPGSEHDGLVGRIVPVVIERSTDLTLYGRAAG